MKAKFQQALDRQIQQIAEAMAADESMTPEGKLRAQTERQAELTREERAAVLGGPGHVSLDGLAARLAAGEYERNTKKYSIHHKEKHK